MKIQGATLKFHVYRLTQEDAATETMHNDSEDLPVSSHWILPAKEFHYLWESLYFDCHIKEEVSQNCFIYNNHPDLCNALKHVHFSFSCSCYTLWRQQ